jgi:hypothetical protein
MFLVWCHLLDTSYMFFSLFVVTECYYVTIKSTLLIFYPWVKIVLYYELGELRVCLAGHLDGGQEKQTSKTAS